MTESIVNSKIIISADVEELASRFARILKDDVNNSADFFNLVLSGGSTPGVVFDFLSNNCKTEIEWNKIRFFWGDERCVPPDHPDSNYLIAYKHLFSKIVIPEKNIFRIEGENKPELEAQRYSRIILQNVPLVNNFPLFDLIMLGLGEDGHTASIFPDNLELINKENICEVTEHPISRQKRITLTGKVINNSRKVIFLITGNSKNKIVDTIINRKSGFDKLPASYINPINGELIWLLDKESGKGLSLASK
ncbi:MAG: 6-phosphogluconolactonase [Melioribacter sp.]|nr:6-phosphogluconolactonase [Melioribacter sp.]